MTVLALGAALEGEAGGAVVAAGPTGGLPLTEVASVRRTTDGRTRKSR